MASVRFGSDSLQVISEEIKKCVPANTMKSRKSVWVQFNKFCEERGYDVTSQALPPEKLNVVLMDWGSNMRKADGGNYKDLVVKQMWNCTAKQIEEIYYEQFGVKINPFTVSIIVQMFICNKECC